MPLTLEEILALPDIGQKINYLKKGRKFTKFHENSPFTSIKNFKLYI